MAKTAGPARARPVRTRRPVSYETVRKIGLALPGVEEGLSYGTPALKVQGKMLARLKEDGDSLVVRIGFLEREAALAAQPEVFYITDHYLNYPAMLVRLHRVSRESLQKLLEDAWRRLAPKRLLASRPVSREGND